MVSPINWAAVMKRCRPEAHKKILEARGRHEELRRLISEAKAAMPKIDFAAYRSTLPAASKGLVDQMEGAFKAFKTTKAETGPLLQALDAEKSTKVPARSLLVSTGR